MERYIRVGVLTLLGLLLVLLVWFAVVANQDNKLSPNPTKTQSAIELDDQLTDPEMDMIDNAEVDQESLNKLLPQLEQLAAPTSDIDSQDIVNLKQEADQLIEEMDQLLLDSDFQESDMTQVDQSEIFQHPEFQEGLKQEEALEERLNALP